MLRAELLGDPEGLGWPVMTNAQVVTGMNALTRSRDRISMTGRQVAAEIVDSEYDILANAQKSQLLALLASDDLDPFGLAANVVKNIFPGGAASLSNLQAARVENISRAVEIGVRSPVRLSHVVAARS